MSLHLRTFLQLHCEAMHRAVLFDKKMGGDGHDFPIGEGLTDDLHGEGILGVAGGGDEDGALGDEEIGVGAREAPPVFAAVGGRMPGQRQQAVGPAIAAAEALELGLHTLEGSIVAIRGVVAGLIDDGIFAGEAG